MAQTRVVVLGGGMVGSAIAMDLQRSGECAVTLADLRADALQRAQQRFGVAGRVADLSNPAAVRALAAEFDLVVGALPSAIGLQTLRAVIEARRPYVDISFMSEDARQLTPLAVEHGVTAVVDCGVAPGVSNLMAGHAAARLERCESLEIYVGGLPVERRWPYEYKAGFAPSDVIEEYTRPARLVEHGRIVIKEALSEPEPMDFPGLGTLEAFNTDGLRSLADSIPAPDMKEKTLRWPGHIALMRVLRETGFFSKTPVRVAGQDVVPLELTAALMFPKWTFDEGEADVTVMRVAMTGQDARGRVRLVWDLLDHYDPQSGLRSMSRSTAFPAALVARLLASGAFHRPGVHAPETLGAEPGLLGTLLDGLRARGVRIDAREERLSPGPK
jgi:saccharopine dehydrogenase-like NADP-dependent oxidoreductase